MSFRYKKTINLTYCRQIYIWAHCLNYNRLSWEQQKIIDQLCLEAGGYHHQSLHEFMTQGTGLQALRFKHSGIWEKGGNFYPLVKEFYERLDKII